MLDNLYENIGDKIKNLAKWIFALPFGEYRWLRSGVCGRMTYSCYDPKYMEPYEKLLKTK